MQVASQLVLSSILIHNIKVSEKYFILIYLPYKFNDFEKNASRKNISRLSKWRVCQNWSKINLLHSFQ